MLKVFLTPLKAEWLESSLNPPPKLDYKDGGFGGAHNDAIRQEFLKGEAFFFSATRVRSVSK